MTGGRTWIGAGVYRQIYQAFGKVLLAISHAAADSSCSLPGFQEQKAPVLLQLAASASARSAEGSLIDRLFEAGDAAGHGATQLGPPAIAMSAIALAQELLWGRHKELQSPRLLLQMQQEVEDHAVTSQPTSAGSDTALALSATYRLTSYMAALVLAITIVACLVTYQPKPDYSDNEQAILRTSLQQQHQERMRFEARQEACAC
ncbi:unnamed protein product [Symbiodinium necroappetens]|uniref:Uncharacterized protein n=1 Tax=Symbiodinium necroappetens TaxID=1628268 RepID=A0A813BBY7_9DINO|nr:unnamed protein product [Symbiodinium necroappetens]